MAEEGRNRRFWQETALVFGAWMVFGLVSSNQYYTQTELAGRPESWGKVLPSALFEMFLSALVTVAVFALARRFPLERGRMPGSVAVHLAAAGVVSLARVVVMVEVSRRVDWLDHRPFALQFLRSFHAYVWSYLLLLGIGHAVLYYERYRERQRVAERLAASLTEARLQALKAQLQPHFLFNTLNAISALIPAEAQPARRMVARLGDLLRTALEHEATQEVTLREELAFLEPYLEIEQARLEDRLTVTMSIAPETMDARVPHLLLQPLVENAIRHGIAPRIRPGRVEISASAGGPDDRSLHLEVRDDGPGLDRDDGGRARKGVGLANIRARLEALYDGQHRFELADHPDGGTVVRISLPLRRAGGGEGKGEGPEQ